MKNVKFLLSAALVFLASAALAQDFSGPQYAKWGATPEEREQNILNSNFLKESCDNRDYDAAAHYLKGLIDKIPDAAESIYQRGAVVYKNKINRAKSVAEKNMFIDSLMLMYDMRAQYFGDNVKPGKTAFILDQKAREFLRYKPNDRKGIREAFRAAIAQGGDSTDPETVVAYFSNLCEDYKNTDEVMPDEIIAEYDRLSPVFDGATGQAAEYKDQFDKCFGLSGVASCENLEAMFKEKIAASNNDPDVLAQAVDLMTRAKCDSEFYLTTAEKYYEVKPSAETALFLAQAFQNKQEYDKAIKYLTEALAVETDNVEKEKLLVRIGVVQLATKNYAEARKAALEAQALNPEDGMTYFVLAQCYGAQASGANFTSQAMYWVAYDTMEKAAQLLEEADLKETATKMMAAFRSAWPSKEECFFNEVQAGQRYVVNGIATTVRCIR